MSVIVDTQFVLTGLGQLKIDDSKVNKMIRRRSIRLKEKSEKRRTLDISFDFANNNLLSLDQEDDNNKNEQNVEETQISKVPLSKTIETAFVLNHENVHYQKAIKQFTFINRSEYRIRRNKSDFYDDGGDCGCKLNAKQIQRGELGCRKNCLNREMSIECDRNCKLGQFCGNQRFQNFDNADCTVFITEKKGYGLFASKDIPKNTFIMEFVGEIVSMTEFKKRSREYAKQKTRHCYVMTSSGNKLIDATKKGNLTRFTNHSCDPNAETQKWTVNGECRIGVFSKKSIKTFEEITINYQFERFG